MKQRELETEIAQRTGESVSTIRRRGFHALETRMPIDERNQPLVVDWDLESRTTYQRGIV